MCNEENNVTKMRQEQHQLLQQQHHMQQQHQQQMHQQPNEQLYSSLYGREMEMMRKMHKTIPELPLNFDTGNNINFSGPIRGYSVNHHNFPNLKPFPDNEEKFFTTNNYSQQFDFYQNKFSGIFQPTNFSSISPTNHHELIHRNLEKECQNIKSEPPNLSLSYNDNNNKDTSLTKHYPNSFNPLSSLNSSTTNNLLCESPFISGSNNFNNLSDKILVKGHDEIYDKPPFSATTIIDVQIGGAGRTNENNNIVIQSETFLLANNKIINNNNNKSSELTVKKSSNSDNLIKNEPNDMIHVNYDDDDKSSNNDDHIVSDDFTTL